MNKKLIAVAIAAVVAAPAAMADTMVYGKAHVGINNDAAGAANAWQVKSHASRLGFKGAEDLGNGMKAIFKYEMSYDVSDGGGIGGARNSYVGLSGGFGTFLAGRHDTPAKVAFYAAGNDRLGDSIIDLNSNFGFAELRASNAIAYISPGFSGAKVAVAIVPGETATANGLADAISVGAMYKGNGVKAGIGYTTADNITGGNSNLFNAGATVTMNGFSVGAQYQNVDHAGNSRDVFALTGTAKFGNNKVIALYGNADDQSAGKRDTFGVAVQHIMSKRTSVYAAYRNDDGKAALANSWIGNGGSTQTDDAFGIGMIHTF